MTSIKYKDFIKELEQEHGAVFVRTGKGSHMIYKTSSGTAAVPKHKIVSPGTRRDVYKCLGIDYQNI